MRGRRSIWSLVAAASAGLLLSSCVTSQPGGSGGRSSSIVVDLTHRKILSQAGADQRRPIGGLTQIVTATVVLDWVDTSRASLTERMIVPPSAARVAMASPLRLQPGDRISAKDALYAALMVFDPVAAETLAAHFGRQMQARVGGSDPVATFVGQMNQLAGVRGMSNSRFVHAHGVDAVDRGAYSSATDLAKLVYYSITKSSFNFICSQSKRRISFQRQGSTMAFDLRNTNDLLGRGGIDGVKAAADSVTGQCLVASARKRDQIIPIDATRKRRIPYHLLSVVIGSRSHFGETQQLLQSGWQQYAAWLNQGLVVRDVESELLAVPEASRVQYRQRSQAPGPPGSGGGSGSSLQRYPGPPDGTSSGGEYYR